MGRAAREHSGCLAHVSGERLICPRPADVSTRLLRMRASPFNGDAPRRAHELYAVERLDAPV